MHNFGWLDQWPKGQALTCNFDAVRMQMLGCSDGLALPLGKPGLLAGAPATIGLADALCFFSNDPTVVGGGVLVLGLPLRPLNTLRTLLQKCPRCEIEFQLDCRICELL